MKIICDNQEEYDNLMEASQYLHDFCVGMTCLDQEIANGMVGFLCHLYCDEHDFPLKSKIIKIKKNSFKEIYEDVKRK